MLDFYLTKLSKISFHLAAMMSDEHSPFSVKKKKKLKSGPLYLLCLLRKYRRQRFKKLVWLELLFLSMNYFCFELAVLSYRLRSKKLVIVVPLCGEKLHFQHHSWEGTFLSLLSSSFSFRFVSYSPLGSFTAPYRFFMSGKSSW